MTEKELRRLRRVDLLEMMIALSKENEQLRQELEQTQQLLEKQKLEIEGVESLSDISRRLAETLETAKTVCQQYSKNTHEQCRQMAMANNGVKQDRCRKKTFQKKYLPLKPWK